MSVLIHVFVYRESYVRSKLTANQYSSRVFCFFACVNKQTKTSSVLVSGSLAVSRVKLMSVNNHKHHTRAEFEHSGRMRQSDRGRGSSLTQTYFLSDLNTSSSSFRSRPVSSAPLFWRGSKTDLRCIHHYSSDNVVARIRIKGDLDGLLFLS